MTCQWIIRSLVIALLCLCIAGWVLSYLPDTQVGFHYDNNKGFALGASLETNGQIHLIGFTGAFSSLVPPETWLGFGFLKVPHSYWYAIIPFWFPTTLAATLLWLTWRTTRPKSVGQGFPVETKPQT